MKTKTQNTNLVYKNNKKLLDNLDFFLIFISKKYGIKMNDYENLAKKLNEIFKTTLIKDDIEMYFEPNLEKITQDYILTHSKYFSYDSIAYEIITRK